MRKYGLLVFLTFVSFLSSAQFDIDSSALMAFSDNLILRVFTGAKETRLHYNIGDNPNHTVTTPSTFDFGMGAHSEFAGFHVWLSSGLNIDYQKEEDYKPFYDVQANFYSLRYTFDINWQNYNGGYTYFKGDETYSNKYPVFTNFSINSFHSLNKAFSLSSSFVQTSRQFNSHGSVITWVGLGYNYVKVSDDIIQKEVYKPILGIGYAYNYVWEKFFIGGQVAAAPTLQVYTNSKENTTIGFNTNFRLAFGYNGDRFIYGLSFVDDLHQVNSKNDIDWMIIDAAHVKLFAGYRFHYRWEKHKWYRNMIKNLSFS